MNYTQIPPASGEAELVVIMPNHLGSPLYNERDQRFREDAQHVANSLGAVVVAYERPGTGSSIRTFNLGVPHSQQPSRYMETAAQTGHILSSVVDHYKQPKMLIGDSSAASEIVLVAGSQTFKPDFMGVAGPAGLKNMDRLSFAARWMQNQLYENGLKPNLENSDKKLQLNEPSLKDMVLRAAPEVALYLDLWRSSFVLETLHRIATEEAFGHIAVNLAFSARPFILTQMEQVAVVRTLRESSPLDRPALFHPHILPNTRHSHFNARNSYVDFARDTLSLQQKVAA